MIVAKVLATFNVDLKKSEHWLPVLTFHTEATTVHLTLHNQKDI